MSKTTNNQVRTERRMPDLSATISAMIHYHDHMLRSELIKQSIAATKRRKQNER